MTEDEYINVYPDPCAKLEQVRNILDAYDQLVLDLIAKGSIKSYMLDDGQVRISREYSSLGEIRTGRLAYEQLANRLIAECNGSHFTRMIPCTK